MTTPASPTRHRGSARWGRQVAVFVGVLCLVGLAVFALYDMIDAYLHGQRNYDETALRDWVDEARCPRDTLRELLDAYLKRVGDFRRRLRPASVDDPAFSDWETERVALLGKRAEIRTHLEALGNPPTKVYSGQLPLFPQVYRIEVRFDNDPDSTVFWDSQLPRYSQQARTLVYRLERLPATVVLTYHLHAYNKLLRARAQDEDRKRRLLATAVAATLMLLLGMALFQRRERQRERDRALAEHQAAEAERLLYREARRLEETERALLEQRVAAQEAEQRALELRSQLYAGIGIMAGSYAHNIKNLLVRPNDLLRRCLEADGLAPEQAAMLHEVRHTLGVVTDRLQLILRTVRRDPGRTEPTVLDLNALARELRDTWADVARDKWKMDVLLEANAGGPGGPLLVAADASHLQQAVENLLFNARDATFEMRNHLRDAARKDTGADPKARKQALIAAAAWRGRVTLRTRRDGDAVLLEVVDNGAGMTEEVRRRCTETHFSTKRDNALYEGHSTGMGLGLSFVVTILEHHHATLEIVSAPLQGTTFRLRFPAAERAPAEAPAAAAAEGGD